MANPAASARAPEDRVRACDSFPKSCGRCNTLHDEAAWDRLPLVGYQPTRGGPTLEMRNCQTVGASGETCNSTIAIELGKRWEHVWVDQPGERVWYPSEEVEYEQKRYCTRCNATSVRREYEK